MEGITHECQGPGKVSSDHLDREKAQAQDGDKDELALVLGRLVRDQHALAGNRGRGRAAQWGRVGIVWVVLVNECARSRVRVVVNMVMVVVVAMVMVMIMIGRLAAILWAQGLLQGRGAGGHGVDDAVSIDNGLLGRTREIRGGVGVRRECLLRRRMS